MSFSNHLCACVKENDFNVKLSLIALVARPADLSEIPRLHVMEGEALGHTPLRPPQMKIQRKLGGSLP